MSKIQYTALYERLFLEEYAKKNGFDQFRHFTDDGISGTTFDRKGFKAMIEEVLEGNISTIIVKDMSRFGRDYLKVGYYTEIMFVEKGVRFIAINNNIDSANQTDSDFTPFAERSMQFFKTVWRADLGVVVPSPMVITGSLMISRRFMWMKRRQRL